ncbi:alpha/beta hydrolase [Marinobacter zhejiangensis]|uniref:Acetyl esterase/lipase n=1 Tax=Marinobacter zhejiangensis TaxID=488535 RepID=A0A1I4NTW0_9GAMM|nr:alpha/beta hydrolase [Marinobacter zhejiangensis]SFM18942.1 Acetyl esterase/lipase [Marinobacter zhejiangensis]
MNKQVQFRRHETVLSRRSRWVLRLIRLIIRPMIRFMVSGSMRRMAAGQARVAGAKFTSKHAQEQDYRMIGAPGKSVPSYILGNLDNSRPVILWLHGGAFVLPLMPDAHLRFLNRLCQDLGAAAVAPDYRIAPLCPYPQGLDDCERAYGALLDLGVPASRIVLGGESAGGNLVLGLLQRIRRKGWPMPCCAVPVAAVTDMGRIHNPPSRTENLKRDAMLPMLALTRIVEWYVGAQDHSDPELSPIHADCSGFPPLLLVASQHEVLRDDSVMFARVAAEQGVKTRLEMWTHMPHAFPLLEHWFPEATPARVMITEFMKEHIAD